MDDINSGWLKYDNRRSNPGAASCRFSVVGPDDPPEGLSAADRPGFLEPEAHLQDVVPDPIT